MTEYALPSKIHPAFRRLRHHYDNKGETVLRDIIDSCRIHIETGTEYDNWDGGTTGHDVIIFIPEELIDLVDLDSQEQMFERLQRDLNRATVEIENEYVRAVFIKIQDELDPQAQASMFFSREPIPSNRSLFDINC